MFAECLHWASSQAQPVLTMGDFNETPDTSPVLSLCSQCGLWNISGAAPTTKGKQSWIASNSAIEHMFCNGRALDLGAYAKVDCGLSCSDHYLIARRIFLPNDLPLVRCWPGQSQIEKRETPSINRDPSSPSTLTKWSAKASKRISASFGLAFIDKNLISRDQSEEMRVFLQIEMAKYVNLRTSEALSDWKRRVPRAACC